MGRAAKDTYQRGHSRKSRRWPHQKKDKPAGKVDALIPCWLDSCFDILFAIEVGTWKSDPVELRSRFGRQLRMMGGVDKHVIPRGEAAIRQHLKPLQPLIAEGGYIPLPDHRISPHCSLEQFRTCVRVFKELLAT